jgi:acetyl esterase/lipase
MRALLLLMVAGLLAACSPTRLFNGLASVGAGDVQRIRDQPYGAGERNRLDVYVPPRSDGRPKPVLVFIYGGSWDSGEKETFAFAGLALANRGFVTMVPDYRLVPQVRYPAFLEDNAAAVRWARDNATRFGGDPDRIVIVGHSAGAYNAAMLAIDGRWLERAGVPRGAVRAWAGLAGPYDFLPLDDPATIAAFGRVADLPDTQPGSHVDRGDPPAFLATGATDERVAPHHTRDLAQRIQAAGVPVETRFYPNVGHVGILLAVSSPFRGRAPVLDDMTRFLRARSDAPVPAPVRN